MVTYHIVVGHIQCGRIWYTTFRDPALRLVFRTYKVLHLAAQISVYARYKCGLNKHTFQTVHVPVPIWLPSIYDQRQILPHDFRYTWCSLICPRIAPLQHALKLLVCPGIKIDRLDLADVCSHATMYARASIYVINADSQVNGGGGAHTECTRRHPNSSWPIVDLRSVSSYPPGDRRGRCVRLLRLQSAQLLLPSSFTSVLRVWRFCSARSAAGLGRRDMIGW